MVCREVPIPLGKLDRRLEYRVDRAGLCSLRRSEDRLYAHLVLLTDEFDKLRQRGRCSDPVWFETHLALSAVRHLPSSRRGTTSGKARRFRETTAASGSGGERQSRRGRLGGEAALFGAISQWLLSPSGLIGRSLAQQHRVVVDGVKELAALGLRFEIRQPSIDAVA
jgi:hypothetical protein